MKDRGYGKNALSILQRRRWAKSGQRRDGLVARARDACIGFAGTVHFILSGALIERCGLLHNDQ
jgi:hypothetical protein